MIQAAGGDPQQYEAAEGIDLWAALLGQSSALPARPMYWKTPRHSAVRRGDWKLIVERRSSGTELFNLAEDPLEENELSDEHPDRAAALLDLLQKTAEADK